MDGYNIHLFLKQLQKMQCNTENERRAYLFTKYVKLGEIL